MGAPTAATWVQSAAAPTGSSSSSRRVWQPPIVIWRDPIHRLAEHWPVYTRTTRPPPRMAATATAAAAEQ